jgi:hypothetical protein
VSVARPTGVVVAAALQLLLAIAFLVSASVALLYGPAAQAAGVAELVRQGFAPDVLTREGVRFDDTAAGIVPAYVIAIGFAALGFLNLAGRRAGRVLTFICQPIILILAAVIMTRQVFLVADLKSAFAGNPSLSSLDVQALVDAGEAAMPTWYPHAVRVRFALGTLGSLVVLILLATPSARAWFRAQQVPVQDPRL